MMLIDIEYKDEVSLGSKVIHKETLEVGIVVGRCMGRGKTLVDYPDSKNYPQPNRNIMLIKKD